MDGPVADLRKENGEGLEEEYIMPGQRAGHCASGNPGQHRAAAAGTFRYWWCWVLVPVVLCATPSVAAAWMHGGECAQGGDPCAAAAAAAGAAGFALYNAADALHRFLSIQLTLPHSHPSPPPLPSVPSTPARPPPACLAFYLQTARSRLHDPLFLLLSATAPAARRPSSFAVHQQQHQRSARAASASSIPVVPHTAIHPSPPARLCVSSSLPLSPASPRTVLECALCANYRSAWVCQSSPVLHRRLCNPPGPLLSSQTITAPCRCGRPRTTSDQRLVTLLFVYASVSYLRDDSAF
ncbi:hypothetical protein CC78DRAFT_586149 [Lojkania enalia]|uniref:Uncharacterized protein n=1 Tax=Lojkania enalia TaxID=147567 RepID=A0A9P4JZI9_9PLEO|nr:hypothetical protein CC78DRAFT_586149 [Didymosphaeria enalia]